MKHLIFTLTLILTSFSITASTHMLSGSSSSSLNIFRGSDTILRFDMTAGYYYKYSDNFQFGTDVTIIAQESINVFYGIAPGVVYNFNESNLLDTMFMKFNLNTFTIGEDAELSAHIEYGKRVELNKKITWSPSIKATRLLTVSNAKTQFIVNLFKIDFFL